MSLLNHSQIKGLLRMNYANVFLLFFSRYKRISAPPTPNLVNPSGWHVCSGFVYLLFLFALLFRPTGTFLSFARSVDGTTFTSSIKEKTVARALYSQARAKGKSTGLVR